MGKLIISTTMTVDAVVDVGDWYVPGGGHDAAGREQFRAAAAMLIGRKTYEGLAAYWTTQEGPWAETINPMPKHVASRTLSGELDWNATVLEGDAVEAVPGLKERVDGDIVMVGCGELARDLLKHGLVDELRFWLHPSVQGDGARPFGGEPVRMRLIEATPFDSGVTLVRYEPTAATSS